MVAFITLIFLASLLSTSTASPIYQIGEVIGEIRDLRAESRLESRSGSLLTGQISFQTVTTSQRYVDNHLSVCELSANRSVIVFLHPSTYIVNDFDNNQPSGHDYTNLHGHAHSGDRQRWYPSRSPSKAMQILSRKWWRSTIVVVC